MAQYGEVRVDYITYTTGTSPNEANATVTVSGLVNNPTFSGDVQIDGDLTVNGDLNASGITISGFTGLFADGTVASPSITFAADQDTGFYRHGSNEVGITTSGINRLFVGSEGRIGFGTTTPGQKFEVYAPGFVSAQIKGDTTSETQLRFEDNTAARISNQEDSSLIFDTNASERMRILNTGEVGIGTSAPNHKLTVDESTALGNTAGDTVNLFNLVSLASTNQNLLNFELERKTNGSDWTTAIYKIFRRIDLTDKNYIEFGNDILAFGYGSDEHMRISSQGDVGIGTNNPLYRLTVQGGSASIGIADKGELRLVPAEDANGHMLRFGGGATDGTEPRILRFVTSGDTERMRIDAVGHVGMKTSNPLGNLHVSFGTDSDASDAEASFYLGGTAANGRLGVIRKESFGTGARYLKISASAGTASNSSEALALYNYDDESGRVMTVTGGKVGIGTSNPGALLEVGPVNNSIKATGADLIFTRNASYLQHAGTGFMKFRDKDSSEYITFDYNSGNNRLTFGSRDYMTFRTANPFVERMRINNLGDVSIGTTSPASKFDVYAGTLGQNQGDEIELVNFRNSNGNGNYLRFYDYRHTAGTSWSGTATRIQRRTDSTDQGYIEFGSKASGSGSYDVAIGSRDGETARFTLSKQLLVGTTASRGNWANTTGLDPLVQFEQDGNMRASITRTSANEFGAQFWFGKTRGSAYEVVSNDDALGEVSFMGGDGSNMVSAASITSKVDGTTGANDMPGRLVFSTTKDGEASPTERMRINRTGNVLVGSSTTTISTLYPLQVVGNRGLVAKCTGGTNAPPITVWNNAASGNNLLLEFRTDTVDANRGNITYNRSSGLISYNTTSDYRAKTLHENLQSASATVNLLNVYSGTMHGATDSRPMMVAHEVQEIAPYCVTGEKDAVDENGKPIYQTMDHSSLVPLLTAALQEALVKIESLEQRLADAGL